MSVNVWVPVLPSALQSTYSHQYYKSLTSAFSERRISVEVLGDISGIESPDLQILSIFSKSVRVVLNSWVDLISDMSGAFREDILAKNPSGTDSPSYTCFSTRKVWILAELEFLKPFIFLQRADGLVVRILLKFLLLFVPV